MLMLVFFAFRAGLVQLDSLLKTCMYLTFQTQSSLGGTGMSRVIAMLYNDVPGYGGGRAPTSGGYLLSEPLPEQGVRERTRTQCKIRPHSRTRGK